MPKYLLFFFILFFSLLTEARADFVTIQNCDSIPAAQRLTNGTFCLQTTTTGGRTGGVTYVWNGTTWVQDSNIPRVTNATKPVSPKTGDVVVVTDAANSATCILGGGISNNTCQWDGSAWIAIGGSSSGSGGHIFKDETVTLSNQPLTYINCTGGGISCTPNIGTNSVDLAVTAGAESDPVVGAIVGIVKGTGSGVTAAVAGTDYQGVDPDLTALAVNTTAGFWATAINAARSMATASVNNITIVNPTGSGGNPTWDVGPNVALTSRSFTPTTGDFNFSNALSLTFPIATSAAPTANGRIAFDSTAAITSQSYKVGIGGATWSVALVNGNLGSFTGTFNGTATGYQPLDTDLTQLGGITGAINRAFIHNGTQWTFYTRPNCNGANDVPKWDNVTFTETCGTFAGGISGLTAGVMPEAASATTLTNGVISRSGAVVTINATTVQQGDCAVAFCISESGTYTANRTRTRKDASGTEAVMTGVFTVGNVVTTDAGGLLIDGGAAGTGTWTDSSTNTGMNKTLVDEAASTATTGNTITTPIMVSYDGGALTPDGTNCTDATKQTINSGPTQYVFVCPTPNSAIFDAVLIGVKHIVTTFRVRLKANDTVAATALAGTFKAQCRASGTAPSGTWGSTQTVSITLTTANITYQGLTAAISPDGTCSAGSDLYLRYNATGGSNSATTRIIGLVIEQLS